MVGICHTDFNDMGLGIEKKKEITCDIRTIASRFGRQKHTHKCFSGYWYIHVHIGQSILDHFSAPVMWTSGLDSIST